MTNTYKCPACGYEQQQCDINGCDEPAEYEGWIKRGVMNTRMMVCRTHLSLTIGWQRMSKEERQDFLKTS